MIETLERRLKLESADNASGPAMDRTLHELLGEALLAAGNPKASLAQFQLELVARPNRALALLGAAHAAKAAGDARMAREHYAALAELWKDADADLPGLAEVKAGANDQGGADHVR